MMSEKITNNKQEMGISIQRGSSQDNVVEEKGYANVNVGGIMEQATCHTICCHEIILKRSIHTTQRYGDDMEHNNKHD